MQTILSRKKIEFFLEGGDDSTLFTHANTVKRVNMGMEVYLRAVVEFSNFCCKKCHYCGLRAPNRCLERYRLTPAEILKAVDLAVVKGAATIVLQSGDDYQYSSDDIGALIKRIKARHDVAVTLSLGDREEYEYAYWFKCGADRALIKLETTDLELFRKFRPGENFEERLHRINFLKAIGYEVGSGVIAGFPESSTASACDDILFLSELDLEMIAVGPFIPHPDTPLSVADPTGNLNLSDRINSILRIFNPFANIPATSALDSCAFNGRKLALLRGCNVLMPSVTPDIHRKRYSIYPGKNSVSVDKTDSMVSARKVILSLGLIPSKSKGFSKKTSLCQLRHRVECA